VKPEAKDYLERAQSLLAQAIIILDTAGVAEQAARVAYSAGFNAAQALIFSRRGRAAKTHRGLRAAFAELAQTEPSIDPVFATFLGQAYRLKERTDYGIGAQPSVTDAEAKEMLGMAERLIDCITQTLASTP
jgi:uncharacterized protein (UPF0332 family)